MKICFILLFFLFFSSLLYPLQIAGVRYSSQSEKVRVVLDLDSYPFYRVEKAPSSLHVYLPGYEGDSRTLSINSELVKRLIVEPGKISTSLTIELAKENYNYRVFPLTQPYRLVIDLFSKKSSKNLKKIVIDPGHGGKDPGAIGWGGLKEKDITLKIALYLRDYLENEEFDVFLTRKRDIFVPLSKRVSFSNSHQADLFISIHCNASLSRYATGFETYYLAEALDPLSRAVARVENSVLNLEDEVEKRKLTILEDLDFLEYRKESIMLARFIQEGLDRYLSTPNRGHKSALFYVLKGIDSPGVLVETGFISSPYEARMFRKDSYLKKIALGIQKGILNFRKEFEASEGFTRKFSSHRNF
ncbi:N-acetylmuramoyl-L-alanine amidase [Candidatus Calescamantes bacterium]|nr:N-acetylmuramoyl-L-alanine amidase [Candidatus Calescamantes bacterium]